MWTYNDDKKVHSVVKQITQYFTECAELSHGAQEKPETEKKFFKVAHNGVESYFDVAFEFFTLLFTYSFLICAHHQCWTVGTIFTFGRSRMFGTDKLRPLAIGHSRSHRIKKMENICHKSFDQQSFQLYRWILQESH